MHTLINEIRKKRNISLYQLSKKSGVTYSTIYRFITYEKDIKASNMIAILSALDIDLVESVKKEHLTDESNLNLIDIFSKIKLRSHMKKSVIKVLRGEQIGT